MSTETKRALRTILQTALALAVILPTVVDVAQIPTTWPWVAGALAVAGGGARVMAMPGVQQLLPTWLRTDEDIS